MDFSLKWGFCKKCTRFLGAKNLSFKVFHIAHEFYGNIKKSCHVKVHKEEAHNVSSVSVFRL